MERNGESARDGGNPAPARLLSVSLAGALSYLSQGHVLDVGRFVDNFALGGHGRLVAREEEGR